MAKEELELDDDLLDFEEEDDLEVDEAHDPMNAEVKSNDSVRKAAHTGPRGKKRHADKSNSQAREKVNKGIVRELYDIMNEMSQEELRSLHGLLTNEDFDLENADQNVLEDVDYDFSNDLTDLVESEATLSEDFKGKAAVIMETAIKSKLKEEISRLEESYEEALAEETEEMQEELVEKIDSYLNYVVENWMEENELAIENGLRTEIAEGFMNGLKDLFTESYIEVPEDKVDLVDDLAEQVDSLEAELNARMESTISMREELEAYKRKDIILTLGEDLADTQLDRLAALAEDVDFDDEETFYDKVSNIKEAYFGKKRQSTSNRGLTEDLDDDDTQVEVTGNMAAYVNALKKSVK